MDALKVLIGQRSMWAFGLAALCTYLGMDPATPKMEAATAALAGGGGAALVAQLTYWVKVPIASVLKLLAGATSISYAIFQALGSSPEESARMAETVGGLADIVRQLMTPEAIGGVGAGALVAWSGVQKNRLAEPSNPKLRNRSQ